MQGAWVRLLVRKLVPHAATKSSDAMTKTRRRKINKEKNKRRFGFVVLMGFTCSLSPMSRPFVLPDSLPVGVEFQRRGKDNSLTETA